MKTKLIDACKAVLSCKEYCVGGNQGVTQEFVAVLNQVARAVRIAEAEQAESHTQEWAMKAANECSDSVRWLNNLQVTDLAAIISKHAPSVTLERDALEALLRADEMPPSLEQAKLALTAMAKARKVLRCVK